MPGISPMKTYSAKASEIEKKWIVIDAEGVVLGRLASHVANILRGKHKVTYTPHMDCGDHVIVVNAGKVALTGKKYDDKRYYRHTGHPGGIKETSPKRILEGAVKRMIPRGPLGRQQMTHLHIYGGAAHPHEAQQPATLDFAARNRKNVRIA
jgi:large subunit ribosomal protein L13